jgi:hypothetical protein
MALEAVQAQAGHRSLESTRVYLHLSSLSPELRTLLQQQAAEEFAAHSERVHGTPTPRRSVAVRGAPR